MSNTQKKFADYLQSLVGFSYSLDDLIEKLTKESGINIRLEDSTDNENDSETWNLMFNIEDVEDVPDNFDLWGYFDLYALKTRHENVWHIVEVGIEFT